MRRKLNLTLLTAPLLLLLSAAPVYAQSSSDGGLTADEERQIERDLIRLEGCERLVVAKDAQILARDEKITLLERMLTLAVQRGDELAKAAEARREANERDDEIKASYERQLAAAERRIAEQDARIRSLEGQRKWWFGAGAIFGAAGTKAVDDD